MNRRNTTMHTTILTAALAAAALPAMAARTGDLIGRTVPPYPNGLIEQQGSCIAGDAGYEHICDHGIAVLGKPPAREGELSKPLFVVGQRMVDKQGDDHRWQVTDAVKAPALKRGYLLETTPCRFGGRREETVIAAVVRYREDRETSTDVIWARRLDPASGRLLPIPGRIECANPAAGI